MKKCRPLTEQEVGLLLAIIDDSRDYLLFLMGIKTGYRISELLSLRVRDVLGDEITVKAKNTKTKKSHTVLVAPDLKIAIQRYVKGMSPDDHLYISRSTRRKLTRFGALRILQSYYTRLGLQGNLGSHTLRKTFAMRVYELSGHDIYMTQSLLGHSDIGTTVKYLDLQAKARVSIMMSV